MVTMLSTFRAIHRDHGLGRGAYFDAKIHVWYVYRCPCGGKLFVPEDQCGRGEASLGEVRE
jgi:hypothetical protein